MTHLKIVCLAVLLLWKFVTVAQDRSVAFEELTFQEALAKAKQNNKLLFVDCYTSWCGPCKMLAREVFTNNEVADYFNAHFISLKVDCEKGEGPALREWFGVSSYPTLLFIDGNGKMVNKIMGASQAPRFLARVKEALDPKNSISRKEAEYEAGNRERAFMLDLISSYKKLRDAQKATKISMELLSGLSEKDLLTQEMWNVVCDYYVSSYGSKWWNFILEHGDEYAAIVGKDAVANKIGETLHPYLFGYACALVKSKDKQEFETFSTLVEHYQPKQKEILNFFIELGKSASFDNFNGYFKTVLKVVPRMDRSEHYRFFANALKNLVKDATPKQKKQLLALLKKSQEGQTDYFKPLYQTFFDEVEKA